MAKYVNVLSEIVDITISSLCAELFDLCSRFKSILRHLNEITGEQQQQCLIGFFICLSENIWQLEI